MIFKPGDEVTVVNDRSCWCSTINPDRKITYVVESVRKNHNASRTGAAHTQNLTMTDGTSASGYWFDPNLVGLSRDERERRLQEEEVSGVALTRSLGLTLEWLAGLRPVLELLDAQQLKEIQVLIDKSKEAV